MQHEECTRGIRSSSCCRKASVWAESLRVDAHALSRAVRTGLQRKRPLAAHAFACDDVLRYSSMRALLQSMNAHTAKNAGARALTVGTWLYGRARHSSVSSGKVGVRVDRQRCQVIMYEAYGGTNAFDMASDEKGVRVTGAVSMRAVRASARRRRSGVEPLFSLLSFILSRCAVYCILFSRCSLLNG